jgi:hypothetical protein
MEGFLVDMIFTVAVFYLGHRAYFSFFKRKSSGCAKCLANKRA